MTCKLSSYAKLRVQLRHMCPAGLTNTRFFRLAPMVWVDARCKRMYSDPAGAHGLLTLCCTICTKGDSTTFPINSLLHSFVLLFFCFLGPTRQSCRHLTSDQLSNPRRFRWAFQLCLILADKDRRVPFSGICPRPTR